MGKKDKSLRELLAQNIKANRQKLKLSQEKFAEKANISTQYLAMIEVCRKFPSPETLERIAAAFKIEAAELFSQPPSPAGELKKLSENVLADINTEVCNAVREAAQQAVQKVVSLYTNDLEA
ncbi:hypothetical protein AGMMS49928_29410 [Spirochaetia bacterium]|nr:hypothetical protein AGMMS49928_29410 [Spirochaetia bacterium]